MDNIITQITVNYKYKKSYTAGGIILQKYTGRSRPLGEMEDTVPAGAGGVCVYEHVQGAEDPSSKNTRRGGS